MIVNVQIPLPSFEDFRKILQFWIDQQDKWFYFETAIIKSGSTGESDVPNALRTSTKNSTAKRSETNQYIQARIVGSINDVVLYPPSLLLQNVSVFKVRLTYGEQTSRLVSREKRDKYGLVFSQITYYEPIDNVESFLMGDVRVTVHRSRE